jgi:hypothetical protein
MKIEDMIVRVMTETCLAAPMMQEGLPKSEDFKGILKRFASEVVREIIPFEKHSQCLQDDCGCMGDISNKLEEMGIEL